MPGFTVEIDEGRIQFVHIFRARLWFSKLHPQDLPALVYRKLIEVAVDAEVDAELCLAN
ncbi:MAG: hypothetical protein ACRELG_13230 [Gemmataceae bacterium]